MNSYVMVWGGGDLATGVVFRLNKVGIRVLVVEKEQPLAVRRTVAFAQAVYDGKVRVEDLTARLIAKFGDITSCWTQGEIPVLVDPDLTFLSDNPPLVLVDARMRKKEVKLSLNLAELVVGLGPGFMVNENCHAAVETNRGHFLGRVYWHGSPEPDTGIPGRVDVYAAERVLHAPTEGVVEARVNIGDSVIENQTILMVGDEKVIAPFSGVVRGLIHPGLTVRRGMKVGDVDPRPETFRCWFVSEKSLAIGGGVLEAILTKVSIRNRLWED